jgi:hypothetical protein
MFLKKLVVNLLEKENNFKNEFFILKNKKFKMTEILNIKFFNNRKEIDTNKNSYDEIDDINLIKLICKDQEFELKAETECCDWSYFKFENIQSIIGQKIIGINNGENHIRSYEDKKRPEKNRYIKTYHHILHFENDKTFLLQLINNSNGYYHGSLEIKGKSDTLINYKPNSIIIIVGMPGAGKTSYGNSIKKENDRIFDDVTSFLIINEEFTSRRNIFISSLYCDGYRYKNLIKSLCIANPKEVIQTICFDLNTEQSIINVKHREDPNNTLNNNNNNFKFGMTDNNEINKTLNEISEDSNLEDDIEYAKNMTKVMKNTVNVKLRQTLNSGDIKAPDKIAIGYLENNKDWNGKHPKNKIKEEINPIKKKIDSLIRDIDHYSGYYGYKPKHECYINPTFIPTYVPEEVNCKSAGKRK